MVNEYIDNLLARYFSGEASPQDEAELDKWITSSNENEDYFNEMTFIYESVANIEEYPSVDVDAAFNKFKKHIDETSKEKVVNEPKKKRSKHILWQVVAAAAVITGLFLFINNPFKEQANYVLADNDTHILLPNNVSVKLYSGSSIEYDKEFKNNTVSLEGKADFEVDSEKSGAIIVKIRDVYIEDIGTIFTVDALKIDSIQVSVEEGKVRFYTEKHSMELEAGETGLYLEKERTFKHVVADSPNIIKTASFKFEASSLKDAIAEINKAYSANVVLKSKELENMQISVSFNNEEMGTVVEIMASTLGLKLEYENDKYIISK